MRNSEIEMLLQIDESDRTGEDRNHSAGDSFNEDIVHRPRRKNENCRSIRDVVRMSVCKRKSACLSALLIAWLRMKDSNLRNGGFRVHCLTAWLIRKDNTYYIIDLENW